MMHTEAGTEFKIIGLNSRSSKHVKTVSRSGRRIMKIVTSITLMLSLTALLIGAAFAKSNSEAWTPNPHFRIEQRSFKETLIFIAGVSYALTSSNSELKQLGKQNFFCLKDSDNVGSKLLIDILNEKHTGSITSEQAIETIVQGLKKRYPCP